MTQIGDYFELVLSGFIHSLTPFVITEINFWMFSSRNGICILRPVWIFLFLKWRSVSHSQFIVAQPESKTDWNKSSTVDMLIKGIFITIGRHKNHHLFQSLAQAVAMDLCQRNEQFTCLPFICNCDFSCSHPRSQSSSLNINLLNATSAENSQGCCLVKR